MRRTRSAPLRFVAAAHAVMPWAFPGYHDESHAWLTFIDESHVRYYAELRDVSVSFLLRNAVCRAPPRWESRAETRNRQLFVSRSAHHLG